MKLNSGKKGHFQKGVYIAFLIAIAFDLIIWNIEGSLSKIFFLGPVAFAILIFVIYRGNSIFKYDSEGEVLNFTSENGVFKGWRIFVTHFEFPKRKLLGYSVVRLPFKKFLRVKIKSKQGVVKRRINVTYLSANKLNALTTSLNKVVAQNNKVKHERGANS